MKKGQKISRPRVYKIPIGFKNIHQRFWSKVIKTDYCWNWSGCLNKTGYGDFYIEKMHGMAHRVSAMLHGLIEKYSDSICVLHKCDNRICVNPDHLFLGTRQDNVNDMINKKRNIFGDRSRKAKLSNENAEWIKRNYKKGEFGYYKIAKKFGIDYTTVRNIIKGRTWKWLVLN